MKRLYIVLIFFTVFSVSAKTSEKWVKEKIEQVHVGNFSLPVSQQPGPLIGFGQNIVDKGNCQLFTFIDRLKRRNEAYLEFIPSVLYGITDKVSLFVELPVALKFTDGPCKSRGLEDAIVQIEGVVHADETVYTVNEITAVGNMSFPTGSTSKNPPTGFGAVTFFLGFTASHTQTDWYYFTAFGTLLTTTHKHIKFGNEFMYQFGVSRNIAYRANKWVFNWMIELDGVYRQRNKIAGLIDCNSGGNTVILGPSLWFSTERFIVQGGISAVVADHLFGVQNKDKYYAVANFGWKF